MAIKLKPLLVSEFSNFDKEQVSLLLGPGLSNLEYAHCAEVMGRCVWASEVFNCSAPDTGNMEVLARYGSPTQQRRWLIPLLRGEIRSCFAMTEPAVASSDATNIQSSITKTTTMSYTLNGKKWWISGACDPRCAIAIFMGKTDPQAASHAQQSMILVPMNTPGITIIRPLPVFGFDDAPHGHAEMEFDNVVVPAENLLLGEGRGFEIAQGRLGPGRLHHCMRVIGMGERSLELLVSRATERKAFGKELAGHQSVRLDIANSRIELNAARLTVLEAARALDEVGNKAARGHIAAAKAMAPSTVLKIIDRSIQVHGGAGVSDVTPLSGLWAAARTLRLADGPDVVHLETIAKLELSRARRSKL
jgi:alkylation response protein AidB-like acyl-CoA dehydrogenase